MTVIARAPLRIGLAGGGTDLPAYADSHGGMVLSTAIDRYVYAFVSDAPADSLQITAADANSMFSSREHLFDAALFWSADYRLPTEILNYFGIRGGRRVFIASEVPPGTGLGSSSSTAVALISALCIDAGRSMTRGEIAELACHIEIERMGMPIGRQDQYAAAFGGLNTILFNQDKTSVVPCNVPESTRIALQERLLLFFTGRRRRSTDILTEQRESTGKTGSRTLESLHRIKELADEMHQALLAGDLDHIGRLLDQSWQQKRQLASGVSNQEIDGWYQEAMNTGALGGKITGAGGGGFLLLYAEPSKRAAVIQRMSELGLGWVDIGFDFGGVTPVMPSPAQAMSPAD